MSRYILGAIIGILSYALFTMSDPKILYTPKAYVRRIVKENYDTIPLLETDTLYRDSIVYQIPIFPYSYPESLPFFINAKEYRFPFLFEAKGYLKEYSFTNEPLVIRIEPEKDRSSIYWKIGAITLGVSTFALSYMILTGR